MQVQRTQIHFSNFLLVIWTTTHLKHIYNPSRQPAYCNLVFSSIYLGQCCKLSHLSLWSLFPFHIFTHTAFFLLTAFKVLYPQFLRTHSPNRFFYIQEWNHTENSSPSPTLWPEETTPLFYSFRKQNPFLLYEVLLFPHFLPFLSLVFFFFKETTN